MPGGVVGGFASSGNASGAGATWRPNSFICSANGSDRPVDWLKASVADKPTDHNNQLLLQFFICLALCVAVAQAGYLAAPVATYAAAPVTTYAAAAPLATYARTAYSAAAVPAAYSTYGAQAYAAPATTYAASPYGAPISTYAAPAVISPFLKKK
ncbi:cuticle protein 16.5-like [Drosophila novamexicana]|uniref:cuticle protein 16.5-like n=1 Tax=Drosophila novamexicana TaxID=47314 RepID=UPI0011E59FC8|nr:cuticle protein 16.5-like [Drosophila novamexicana]